VQFFSVDVDGFLAEYAFAPANILWRNPRGMRWDHAALQESLGNSVYTVQRAGVTAQSTVVVFGCGPTGLNCIAVCRALGARRVVAVAGSATHLRLAERMGAHCVVDRHKHKADVVSAIYRAMQDGGNGPTVCLEMSGSPHALTQALQCVQTCGTVSVLGLYAEPLRELDVSKLIVLKDLSVQGVYGRRIWDTWRQTHALMTNAASAQRIDPVITHRFGSIEPWQHGVNLMLQGACGKCVFYPHGIDHAPERELIASSLVVGDKEEKKTSY
jgi:threonine 3-dehydrogenase